MIKKFKTWLLILNFLFFLTTTFVASIPFWTQKYSDLTDFLFKLFSGFYVSRNECFDLALVETLYLFFAVFWITTWLFWILWRGDFLRGYRKPITFCFLLLVNTLVLMYLL